MASAFFHGWATLIVPKGEPGGGEGGAMFFLFTWKSLQWASPANFEGVRGSPGKSRKDVQKDQGFPKQPLKGL